jgi:hypothetical protein
MVGLAGHIDPQTHHRHCLLPPVIVTVTDSTGTARTRSAGSCPTDITKQRSGTKPAVEFPNRYARAPKRFV